MFRRFAGWLFGLMACGDPACASCAPRLRKRARARRVPFACNIGSHVPYLRSEPNGGPQYQGCQFCDYRHDR
jgi:hypothetical protein